MPKVVSSLVERVSPSPTSVSNSRGRCRGEPHRRRPRQSLPGYGSRNAGRAGGAITSRSRPAPGAWPPPLNSISRPRRPVAHEYFHPNVEIIEGDILAIDLHTRSAPSPAPRPGTGTDSRQSARRRQSPRPHHLRNPVAPLQVPAILFHHGCNGAARGRRPTAASPGRSDYGLLSATAQLYAKVEKLFTFSLSLSPPGAFNPPPKVQSTVVRLTISPRLEKLDVGENGFIDFLKLSFGQKRKTLWNNLKLGYEPQLLRAALNEAGIKPTDRAEALSLEKSAALYRALHTEAAGN